MIKYNKNQTISIVSEDPLTFLPLLEFFNNIRLITDDKQKWLQDLNLGVELENLKKSGGPASNITAKAILKSNKFVKFVESRPKSRYLLYSPLDPPYKVNPLYYLMNSPTVAHAYENKSYFREEFDGQINLPKFKVISRRDISKDDFDGLKKSLKLPFVVQDSEGSGSKGTYIVKDYKDFLEAVLALKSTGEGSNVVMSEFVKGGSMSVQACITKYGIFNSGVQRMIIGSKYLCNPGLEGATSFCGGEVGGKYANIVYKQIDEMVKVIGERLQGHGYKGIFGIDFMLTKDNIVYPIEVNARHTALSHIVADMQSREKQIPFLLMNVLELGHWKYTAQKELLPTRSALDDPVSYLILNNKKDGDFYMQEYIKPGIYTIKGGKAYFKKTAWSIKELSSAKDILVFCKYDAGSTIPRGKRILKITYLGESMNVKDLNSKSQKIVTAVQNTFNIDFKKNKPLPPQKKIRKVVNKTLDQVASVIANE